MWRPAMVDWSPTTLGQFVSLQRGHDLPAEQRSDGNIPVMGSFGITGWHNLARANGPGVTVGRSGASIGVVSYIDRNYWPLNTCLFATDFHGNNPRFVYYFLKVLDLAAHNSGSAQPSLNRNYIAPIKINVPDRPEQDHIVGLLGSLDDKIELNRRMNETLEAMAQAIFRDWFVDFGPTRRKIEGATNPIETMGGLVTDPDRARELADLFPARLGDDGLPEGWSDTPIGELAEIVGGSTPSTKTEEYWIGGHHIWATPKDLSKLDGLFLFDTERRITDAGLAKIGSGLSPAGTVLLSSRAPIGYLAVADAPTAVNQGFIAIRPSRRFPTAMALLWCQANMEKIVAAANGSTFLEISKRNFRPLPITYASDEVVDAFDGAVAPMLDLMRTRSHENRTLAATRDLLLPKLMSGEIRLRDAEREIEAVA